jgi:hypothetical protein
MSGLRSIVFFLLLSVISWSHADILTGRVVRVTDGDTHTTLLKLNYPIITLTWGRTLSGKDICSADLLP